MKDCPVKKCLVPALAVFFFMTAYETLVHSFLLANMYKATASLWRPEAEMSALWPWMAIHTAFLAALFTCLYSRFSDKQPGMCATSGGEAKPPCPHSKGVCFGLKIGLIMGVLCSRSYAWTPIPMELALAWFFASLAEGVGIGMVLSAACRKRGECTPT